MVFDHYQPKIPVDWGTEFIPGTVTITSPQPEPQKSDTEKLVEEIAALRKVIADFREALQAAMKVDRLTNQPDCADPEKAKLEQRVADLERRLDAASTAFRAPDLTR